MIFKQCIETGVFPSEWKESNTVPIHKKRKQTNTEQLPVFSLPICGKIFERLLCNEMFNFLMKINLFLQINPVLNRVILVLISCYLSLMRYMNLSMWGLMLEASIYLPWYIKSIWYGIAWWYHLQTNFRLLEYRGTY